MFKQYIFSLLVLLTITVLVECIGSGIISDESNCGEVINTRTLRQASDVNVNSAPRGDYPWHVAIYNQKSNNSIKYICGGSIITEKIVLSGLLPIVSLHPAPGEVYPVSEYSVAAGKHFNKWDASEDTDAQKRKISRIKIPDDIYLGSTANFAYDIAVVVVDTPFVFTNLVRPVCVDWNSDFVDKQLTQGELGKVSGWGATYPRDNEASPFLKQLTVPFVVRRHCLQIVPENFKRFVTPDKFCAGYTNGSSLCVGDAGGGLIFPNEESGKKKYYIQGIVSLGPVKEGSCDRDQLTLYTKVSNYISLIKNVKSSN